jgi:Zn-dependent protease
MKYLKTFKILSIKDIDLKISYQFQIFILVLFAISFLTFISNGFLYAIKNSIIIIFSMFFIFYFVVIHEYGHAFAAKYFGYKTRDIILYPMGGVASVSGEWDKKSWHEFVITIFGPITNFLFALITFFLMQMFQEKNSIQYAICELIFKINYTLFIFNLIPVYPMDGGRILRSIISIIYKDWWAATVHVIRASFILGLLAIPLGFYFGHALAGALILFAALNAQQELDYLKNLRELENIEKEKLDLILDYISSSFKENEAELLKKFFWWSVREKISEEIFKKTFEYICFEMQDINNYEKMNVRLKADENLFFKEICEVANK